MGDNAALKIEVAVAFANFSAWFLTCSQAIFHN
jgi:hypothetical protein